MTIYKKKLGHGKVKAGRSDLEAFFVWALKLCRRDGAKSVVVETPDFRVTWDAVKKPRKKGRARGE